MSGATDRLIDRLRAFGGESLRDGWLFDQRGYQRLYLRDDVAATLSERDRQAAIDNERYGYVTHDIYESLYDADYAYTVRGFRTFAEFRTFFGDGRERVGLLASFDTESEAHDFAALHRALVDALPEDLSLLAPPPRDTEPDGGYVYAVGADADADSAL
jgi:hypothetical protein